MGCSISSRKIEKKKNNNKNEAFSFCKDGEKCELFLGIWITNEDQIERVNKREYRFYQNEISLPLVDKEYDPHSLIKCK